jgi:hypothetical protein
MKTKEKWGTEKEDKKRRIYDHNIFFVQHTNT